MRKPIDTRIWNPQGQYYDVWYVDGTHGIEGKPGVGSPEANLIPNQGREGKPVEWSGGAMDGEPATHGEIGDIEMMLENMRPKPEDYIGGATTTTLPKKKGK